MVWKVEFDSAALKDLKRLDQTAQRRIVHYLRERIAIEENPRRLGKALHGDKSGLWRYRVGDYRLLCRIEDNILMVLVIAVGHRSGVYKN
ncbi:MAG: type II toxin-antitoxin system RelE/ParE family toxin [Gammaproteobacteria bacterium]|nr:type II toxin-antitoxin system RelE/ParE family toxin [Gammaproteobacteria bacterium]